MYYEQIWILTPPGFGSWRPWQPFSKMAAKVHISNEKLPLALFLEQIGEKYLK